MEQQPHQHSHDHHHHDHQVNSLGANQKLPLGSNLESTQAGDYAIQSAFSVGLFLLKGLILIVMLVWLFSGVYKVENGESAIELYLGKINPYNGKNVRTENLYWSLPFPFTEVIKIQTKKEHSLRVDVFPQGPGDMQDTANDPLVKGHRNYYITKDMNLLHLGWDITYRIKELDKFITTLYEDGDINRGSGVDKPWEDNSKKLLVQISRSVMLDECSRQIAMDVLTSKNVFNTVVKDRIQRALDKMETGIELTSLHLVQVDPPISVKSSFVEVILSKVRKNQVVTESKGKKEEMLLTIHSEIKKIELDSQNENDELTKSIKAEALRIQTIQQAFKDNPEGLKNYLHQLYLVAVGNLISEKAVEFIDRPENAIYKTSLFGPKKNSLEEVKK